MKKWVFFAIGGLVVVLAGAQWILPQGEFSKEQELRCNVDGANRRICLDTAWRQWWPWESGYTYRITQRLNKEVDWVVEKGNWSVPVRLLLMGEPSKDSLKLILEGGEKSSAGPIERIRRYRRRGQMEQEVELVFARLRAFLEKPENIYGMDVRQAMATDSVLIVTRLSTPLYPTVAEVYDRIAAMRNYSLRHGGKEINPPMLNVRVKEGEYETMIAIPLDREVPGNSLFFSRKFVPWKVLMGEVKGGTHTAETALAQLQLYILDHGKTAMAIPFQSLVTERDREADTSRWITKVVVPVP